MSGAVPAVAIDGASYRYADSGAGVFDIVLTIEPGELLVCIGPSGGGKTTLLKLIAGFVPCQSGRLFLAGEEVTAASPRARQCGIVFQSYALFPHMRVWENVAYPLRVRGVPLGERKRRAEAMLEAVGLSDMGGRLPADLSGGQQQRVALGRALVFGPRVLLLDEPLSALDAATRLAMRDEVRRIQKQQNIAALLITHDQDEALSLADRIAVLRDGRLLQVAPPQQLYDRPADAFVAGFVGRANLLPGRVVDATSVDTPIGRLVTAAHGFAGGAHVLLLIRPERLEVADGGAGEANVFAATTLADRFLGASRHVDLAVGEGRLTIDTPSRAPVTHIRLPPGAVQFLPASGPFSPTS
jgi:putative spermidine/putrescine transport system ATP-binding protein